MRRRVGFETVFPRCRGEAREVSTVSTAPLLVSTKHQQNGEILDGRYAVDTRLSRAVPSTDGRWPATLYRPPDVLQVRSGGRCGRCERYFAGSRTPRGAP